MDMSERNAPHTEPSKRLRLSVCIDGKQDVIDIMNEARSAASKAKLGARASLTDTDIVCAAIRLWGRKHGYHKPRPN